MYSTCVPSGAGSSKYGSARRTPAEDVTAHPSAEPAWKFPERESCSKLGFTSAVSSWLAVLDVLVLVVVVDVVLVVLVDVVVVLVVLLVVVVVVVVVVAVVVVVVVVLLVVVVVVLVVVVLV